MSAAFSRNVVWTAFTCRLDDADLFIGLAAGLDDELAQHLTPRQIAAFPWQEISTTQSDDRPIPLRVYAVRDPSIVEILPSPSGPVIEGFKRVHLRFYAPRNEPDARAEDDEDEFTPPGTVMAFVLTIGLPIEREDDFYDVIVRDFLHKSWMSLPKLLQDIGCAHPEKITASQ